MKKSLSLFLFILIILILGVFIYISSNIDFEKEDLPPKPQIIYPKDGSLITFRNMIVVDELTHENDIVAVNLEYQNIESKEWLSIEGYKSHPSVLAVDYYEALWDILEFPPGTYKLRVTMEDKKRQTGIDEVIVSISPEIIERQVAGFCGCEAMRVETSGNTSGGLTFPPGRERGDGNNTLGPNTNSDYLRYNFMVEADLVAGSTEALCGEKQMLKDTVAYLGTGENMTNSSGAQFPYNGAERTLDGYTTEYDTDGHHVKRYDAANDYIRWIDAPGFKHTVLVIDGVHPVSYRGSFYAEVTGTAGQNSCSCTWDVESELYPNGTVKITPHVFNGPNCRVF